MARAAGGAIESRPSTNVSDLSGEDASDDDAAFNAVPVERGTYAYAFDGVDADGMACSTGKKAFAELGAMCMAIQDPDGNRNDCALRKRISAFLEECEPYGFGFWESRVCRLVLLKKPAQNSDWNGWTSTDVLSDRSWCVGRTRDGKPVDPFQKKVALEKNLFAEVSANLESFRFEIFSLNASGKRLSRGEPILAARDGLAMMSLKTEGAKPRGIVVQCANVWACDP